MIITQRKAVAVLITLFLAVSVAAKSIGSLQPINPALRGFIEGCEGIPQPCWYGIVPGVTTIEEARPLLGRVSNLFPCRFAFVTDGYVNIITVITFTNCKGIQVGDLYSQLGRGFPIGAYSIRSFGIIHSTWSYGHGLAYWKVNEFSIFEL